LKPWLAVSIPQRHGSIAIREIGLDFADYVLANSKWRDSMKTNLPIAFTMIALVGAGVVFAGVSGHADPANAPARTDKHAFSPDDRAAFLDARIAALHAGLKLSPDQEKLWPPVETALRTAAKTAEDRFQKVKDEPESEGLVGRLRRRGENAVARGQSLEAIANAAAPLYATLGEDQKHRLPVLMHGLRPHFPHRHFAMMGGGREPMEWRHGGWNEPEGFAPRDEGDDRFGPKER
jgi:zinc resistance-associated protein